MRRATMVGHKASGFEDAERWDLDFWQRRTPQLRLAALMAIRRDVEMVQRARGTARRPAQGGPMHSGAD